MKNAKIKSYTAQAKKAAENNYRTKKVPKIKVTKPGINSKNPFVD